MFSDIAVVIFIAIGAFIAVAQRNRPFSEDFELNEIYHNPPPDAPTPIKPLTDIEITIGDIQRTMQLAMILAKPDYELAKDPEKYKKILHRNNTHTV
jgi:hypothetical protein